MIYNIYWSILSFLLFDFLYIILCIYFYLSIKINIILSSQYLILIIINLKKLKIVEMYIEIYFIMLKSVIYISFIEIINK